MSTVVGAGQLMGRYLTETVEASGDDIWPAVAAFVAAAPPVAVRLAAGNLRSWLREAPDDDALHALYVRAGGRYYPDPAQWTLRECLRQIAGYLELHVDESLPAALAEFRALPAELVRATVNRAGRPGSEWLRSLPGVVERAKTSWQLELGETFPSSSHLVLSATRRDGSEAVLRIGWVSAELDAAADALGRYDGRGAVRLLEAALDDGAVLVERASPGVPLSVLAESDDERATDVAVGVLQRLWTPLPDVVIQPGSTDYDGPFPFVAWLAEDFGCHDRAWGDRGPIPRSLLRDADRVLRELLASAPEPPTLLHGDLHHANIVSSERAAEGWLAIDPKGWVGDPGYDVGALLYNPLGQVAGTADLAALLDRRLRRLSEQLGMDEHRLRAWGFVKAVVAEVWFVEDDGVTHGVPLRVAQELRTRL